MSDALKPGEIDLESPAPAAPVSQNSDTPAADPDPAEPVVAADAADADDPVADPDPADPADPVADPGQPAKQQPRGAVAELIALRREKKQLAERLQQFETNPVLQRLTPEVQQAIMDGRLQIAPPQGSREAEAERLKEVAESLQLYKVDGAGQTVPDLDAAKRVDKFVRGTVNEAVAPVRQQTLSEKANVNYAKAIDFATTNGLDIDAVHEVFGEVASQPNGAELLANPKIAKTLWRQAMGLMHEKGTFKPQPGKAAPQPAKPPAAVITEPTGRRASAATALTLSPAVANAYKNMGVDPAKSFTAKNTNLNFNGPIELE